MADKPGATARWHRYWDRKAANYDRQMALLDRKVFNNSRQWACLQARGEVLEVAVGTALNLPYYPAEVALTGLDLSERMLELARVRAERAGRAIELRQGNAHALPFADASFDTVVCTLGLCTIPDVDAAIGQMVRVRRPLPRIQAAGLVVEEHQRLALGLVERLLARKPERADAAS